LSTTRDPDMEMNSYYLRKVAIAQGALDGLLEAFRNATAADPGEKDSLRKSVRDAQERVELTREEYSDWLGDFYEASRDFADLPRRQPT